MQSVLCDIYGAMPLSNIESVRVKCIVAVGYSLNKCPLSQKQFKMSVHPNYKNVPQPPPFHHLYGAMQKWKC